MGRCAGILFDPKCLVAEPPNGVGLQVGLQAAVASEMGAGAFAPVAAVVIPGVDV